MATSLRHRDALAIAKSCATLLHGCTASVSVCTDQTDCSLPLWLELTISDGLLFEEPDEIASGVRDAVHVLRALARCPGYAPKLNPHVWEEILVHAGVECGEVRGHLVFDDAFPRVRVVIPSLTRLRDQEAAQHEAKQVQSILQSFAHPNIQRARPSESGRVLEDLMVRLDPFLPPANLHHDQPLEMAVSLPSMDTQWLLPAMATICGKIHREGEIKMVEITLNQSRYKPEDPLDALGWLEKLPGVETISQWTLDESIVEAPVYSAFYRRLLGVDSNASGIKIRRLDVVRPSVDDDHLEAICSALPFTRTVLGLRIRADTEWQWSTLDKNLDWAWLAYALFHEQTPSSSWRALHLQGCTFDETSALAVDSVRCHGIVVLGRFLGAAHDDGDVTTQCVQSGAPVWDDASASGTPVIVLDEQTRFDAIGATNDGFQLLLVPGVGIGYVEVDNMVALSEGAMAPGRDWCFSTTPVQDPPPRCASLTDLSVDRDDSALGSIHGLLALIRTCGSSLTTLAAPTTRALMATEMDAMLSACPNLTTLAIDHDGGYWTNWDAARTDAYPRLTTLRQSCSLIDALATVTALSNIAQPGFPAMRDLCFHVTRGSSVFPSITKALGVVILANPMLEMLTMVKVRETPRSRKAISQTPSERRSKCLRRLGLPTMYVEVPSRPENTVFVQNVRLAMQPVWDALETPLPAEAIGNVFAFAGGVYKRHLWFDLV